MSGPPPLCLPGFAFGLPALRWRVAEVPGAMGEGAAGGCLACQIEHGISVRPPCPTNLPCPTQVPARARRPGGLALRAAHPAPAAHPHERAVGQPVVSGLPVRLSAFCKCKQVQSRSCNQLWAQLRAPLQPAIGMLTLLTLGGCPLSAARSCMTPESKAAYEAWQQPRCLGAKPIDYSWVIAEVSGGTSGML